MTEGMKQYKVNEIFYSIQGEGQWAGMPMVFVRFAGCNLNCHFCDTNHEMYTLRTAQEIFYIIKEHAVNGNIPPVCFTGGEPTIQLDDEIIAIFKMEGICLHLETNGTRDPRAPLAFHTITVSPKLATVGLSERALEVLPINHDLKLICQEEPLVTMILAAWGNLPFRRKFIQPCFYKDDPMRTKISEASAIHFIKHHPEWTLSIQLHRVLGIR